MTTFATTAPDECSAALHRRKPQDCVAIARALRLFPSDQPRKSPPTSRENPLRPAAKIPSDQPRKWSRLHPAYVVWRQRAPTCLNRPAETRMLFKIGARVNRLTRCYGVVERGLRHRAAGIAAAMPTCGAVTRQGHTSAGTCPDDRAPSSLPTQTQLGAASNLGGWL
jgi:hypothetical protein